MANRQSILRDAARLAKRLGEELGRELRVARLTAGMTQREVGLQLQRSASHVSRVEHGLLRSLHLSGLARHAAVVGLRPWVRLYPTIGRPLDAAQLALFARFRARIGAGWKVVLEAPMPLHGDLRAADALLVIAGCRVMVELITRLADVQAQLRAAHRKQRDLGADRLIFVVAATTTNRRAVRDAASAIREALPLGTKEILAALAADRDPGGDGLVLL